ncbi:MAG: glycosyl hydrolase family 28 protein [Siphonobacter sp.]
MRRFLYALPLCILMAFHLIDTNPKRVFLIGDSTMANKPNPQDPERGWGQLLSKFVDLPVHNHAVNGRSTKSFIAEGRWQKVLDELKPGDWVLIQFGHNDGKKEDSTRYAAPQTLYRENLIRFIHETRAKGANPVLITPVMRRRFDEKGSFIDTHGEYPAAVKAVAVEQKVPLLDLHTESRKLIEELGAEGSKKLFLWFKKGYYASRKDDIQDDTHFSEYGAAHMAALIAEAIRQQKLDIPLTKSPFHEKYAYELPLIYQPVFRKDTFNIVRYGAISDGQTLNTKAINQAIDACSQAGGGTVLIPAGFWLTGPIVLKNHVNLHIKGGALLQFSKNKLDYPLVKTTWEGLEAIRCQAPLGAIDAHDIAISGEGIIDGGGDIWRAVKKGKLTASAWEKLLASGGVVDGEMWYPSEQFMRGSKVKGAVSIATGYDTKKSEEIRDFLRPNMLSLTRCQNILLEGVTIQNSPAWCVHPLLCQHITLRNLRVRNPWYAQNGDGVDLESCQYGLIEGCSFDVGDDGICIKSGRDEEGRKRGVPTEQVIIRNSTVFHAHGGFVVGSEMSGGARNLYVSNCNFLGTDVGLRFKTTRGRGGIVENVFVSGIQMTDIPGEAILFDMYYMAKDPVPQAGESADPLPIEAMPLNEGTPQFKNFFVRNVVCKGAETGILIRGLPEMNVKDVVIENAVLESKKGLVCIEGQGITIKNVNLLTQDKNVMMVQNSQNVTLDHIQYRPDTDVLLRVLGKRSKEVKLLNTDTSKAKKAREHKAD